MTTYKRGVTVLEQPTSVSPPVEVAAGLPVVFGTAPIHLAADQSYVNKPLLAYSKDEFDAAMGYSADWDKYTLCEFARSQFELYRVAPVVFINVLDPDKHSTEVPAADVPLTAGVAKINQDGVLLSTLIVKLAAGDATALEKDTDYTAAFDDSGNVVITRLSGGTIPAGQATLNVAYSRLDTSKVTDADLIGGIDGTTGAYSGLELVNKVFPLFRMVPGQILAPGWSHKPTIAAIMKAKAASINGLFKAIAITDVDSSATGADLYSEVAAWKSSNSYTDPLQVVGWPMVKLGSEKFHLSTHIAGLNCVTDAKNDDIPFESPSNKQLQADAAVTANGDEVTLGPDQANYLTGQGIITALNFVGGWRLWGNRTGAFPDSTDVKDVFLPVRRMFNWIANNLVLTYLGKVDDPTNKRKIQSVVDAENIRLNAYTARGALLGGRIEFRANENPLTNLLNGQLKFHLLLTPPVPNEEMEFVLEYDVSNFNSLFT
jgi:phage tail sheath protein FI